MKKVLLVIAMLVAVAGAKSQSMEDLDFLYNRRGWEASVDIGANFTFAHKNEWKADGRETSGIAFIGAGYNFNENIYVGIETGFILSAGKNIEWIDSNEPEAHGTEDWRNANLMPVAALGDIRYSITTHRTWHPFIDVRGGYCFVANNSGSKSYYTVIPRAGANFRMSRAIDLHIAAGYMFLRGEQNNSYKNLDGITVQIGMGVHFW